ncbi:MAG: type II toxin-antitoxin system VapC family toxin [Actinomycetia bacterium]|nr:type II toxin-antitoxin system VapC family toxin [Actinomycetes bacterium]
MTQAPLIAVDTSVAIPLLVSSHESHAIVLEWAAGQTLALSGHALVETYSVLTRLPGSARVAGQDAVQLIDSNFERRLQLPGDQDTLHRELAQLGIEGGAVYDALVALAALKNRAVLATRDATARTTYETVGVRVLLI